MATRSKTLLYLLDHPVTELSTVRLASNGEALGLFFHLHLTLKQPIRKASTSVVEQIIEVWNKARIPTKKKDRAITQLEKLHDEWTN